MDKLQTLFLPWDLEIIRNIPLSGRFTVKSAYYVVVFMGWNNNIEESSRHIFSKKKKKFKTHEDGHLVEVIVVATDSKQN